MFRIATNLNVCCIVTANTNMTKVKIDEEYFVIKNCHLQIHTKCFRFKIPSPIHSPWSCEPTRLWISLLYISDLIQKRVHISSLHQRDSYIWFIWKEESSKEISADHLQLCHILILQYGSHHKIWAFYEHKWFSAHCTAQLHIDGLGKWQFFIYDGQ